MQLNGVRVLLLVTSLLSVPIAAYAAEEAKGVDLKGAAATLQQAVAQQAEPPVAAAKSVNRVAALRGDLETFAKINATLPAGEAARRWLSLFDRYTTLYVASLQGEGEQSRPLSFQEVIKAVPPPAAWNHLAMAVVQRQQKKKKSARETALLFLVHTLKGDKAAQWKDLAALKTQSGGAGSRNYGDSSYFLTQIRQALTATSVDPTRVIKEIQFRLATQRATGQVSQLPLPDLVTLVGAKQAEVLLRRALVSNAEISIPVGDETRRLAQRLALQLVAKMKVPQWQLAYSIDSLKLYEALDKRFAKWYSAKASSAERNRDTGSRRTAQIYYLMGLIAAGRRQDALTLATHLGRHGDSAVFSRAAEAFDALDKAGHTTALHNFLYAFLAKNPNSAFWEMYIPLATHAGQTPAMLKLIRTAASAKGLSADRKMMLRLYLSQGLLAADQVDAAVAVLRQLIATPNKSADSSVQMMGAQMMRATYGIMLARLGNLLNRPEWLEEGLKAARSMLTQETGGEYQIPRLVNLLIEAGRLAEAEKILGDALAAAARGKNKTTYQSSTGTGQRHLIALAGLYHGAGRHNDVITLLDEAPFWNAKDLSEIYTRADANGTPLGYIAAAALAKTDRQDEARKILRALLNARGGFDPAYELLIELEGQAVLPFLDGIYRRDRFEERPLIWKAQLLRVLGRLEEAEKAAREAIAVDPSDGEQKHGHRMRVYAVLADIREARGDAEGATSLRGAVQAIRIAEQADDLYEAGLLQRGIRLYKESLTHFADAYCIQSRLAVQLAAQGRHEEAAAHYRRAYELMPVSFGRMESHCFGCEQAFAGRRATTIAEQVFRRLVVQMPKKPQVHYLLGYLREEQGRYKEALGHFRTAVKLDPDYINAWQHIQSVGAHVHLFPADRDAVILNLLRLDSQGRHAQPDLSGLSSLKTLWLAVSAAAQRQPPPVPQSLYPLPASKVEVEKKEAARKSQPGYVPEDYEDYEDEMGMSDDYSDYDDAPRRKLLTPGQALAEHKVIAALSQIMDTEMQRAAAHQIIAADPMMTVVVPEQ